MILACAEPQQWSNSRSMLKVELQRYFCLLLFLLCSLPQTTRREKLSLTEIHETTGEAGFPGAGVEDSRRTVFKPVKW